MVVDKVMKHPKPLSILIGYLIAASLGFCSSSHSQQIDPKQYFEKDYAVAPSYRPGESGGNSSDQSNPTAPTNQNGRTQRIQGRAILSPQLGNPNPVTTPGAVPTYSYPKTRLLVVVNSLDPIHLQAVVKKVELLARSKRMSVTGVMHIGDPKALTQEMTQTLHALGVGTVYAEVIPASLPITTSPTWVFETNEGKYIVEGGMDPERFISPTGDYLAPVLGGATQVTDPKPEITIEGLR